MLQWSVEYMRIATLFDMFRNPSFKMTSFAIIVRTTGSTSKFIYPERFQIIRDWVFIIKTLYQFVKTPL